MENIIETSHIALDFDFSRENRDLGAYRITTYDKYGNYEEELYLSKRQMKDLIDGVINIKVDIEDEKEIL
jgi:hypothetical protein